MLDIVSYVLMLFQFIVFLVNNLGTIFKFFIVIALGIIFAYVTKEHNASVEEYRQITTIDKQHLLPQLRDNNQIIVKETIALKQRIFTLKENAIIKHTKYPELKSKANGLQVLGAKSAAKINTLLANGLSIGRASSALIMKLEEYDKNDTKFEFDHLIELLSQAITTTKELETLFKEKVLVVNNMTVDIATIAQDINNQGYFLNMPAKELIQNCFMGALAGALAGPGGAAAGCGLMLAAFEGWNGLQNGNAKYEIDIVMENIDTIYRHITETKEILEQEHENAKNFKNNFETLFNKGTQKQIRKAMQQVFRSFRALLFKMHPEEKEVYKPSWTNQLLHIAGFKVDDQDNF